MVAISHNPLEKKQSKSDETFRETGTQPMLNFKPTVSEALHKLLGSKRAKRAK